MFAPLRLRNTLILNLRGTTLQSQHRPPSIRSEWFNQLAMGCLPEITLFPKNIMFFNNLLYDWTLSMRTILRP